VLSLLYLHGLSSKDFVPARAIPGHHRAPDSGILLVLDVLRADEKSILSGPRATTGSGTGLYIDRAGLIELRDG
jgi:hypothetical protein